MHDSALSCRCRFICCKLASIGLPFPVYSIMITRHVKTFEVGLKRTVLITLMLMAMLLVIIIVIIIIIKIATNSSNYNSNNFCIAQPHSRCRHRFFSSYFVILCGENTLFLSEVYVMQDLRSSAHIRLKS